MSCRPPGCTGALPPEQKMRLRDLAKPLTKLLGIGSNRGSEGLWSY
jgi:hypothetical protein